MSERLYGGLRATVNVVKYKIGGNDNTFLGGLCYLVLLKASWSFRVMEIG